MISFSYRLKSKEQALIDKRNAFRRPEYKKLYSITSDFTVLLDQIKDQKDVLNVVKEEEPV
jgi:hypothetical protein